jgi:cephalosporin-C deacetylase-like acetyl esterase
MWTRSLKASIVSFVFILFFRPLTPQGLDVYKSQADARLASVMLYEYLTVIAHHILDESRELIRSVQTERQVRDRQREIREKILSMLGPLPDRTPLEPQITGSFQREGYRVEKLIYQSRPNYYVTANLYIPLGKGDGPFPGILGPCGHSLNGKAAGVYQKVYAGLARLGCVVLVYDQPGQGERFMYFNKELGESTFDPQWPSTVEHTMAGIQCLLTGSNAATYFIWDALRSIDYLLSRPEVDPNRIGITGNSGGGTLSAYIGAVDERVHVAAPSCYITSWKMLWDTIGPQDAEQNLLPFIGSGLDFPDYGIAFAPKPYLINAAIQDFFPIRGTRETFREVKRIYRIMGASDQVTLFEADDGHGYTRPRREAAFRWFGKHFLNLYGPFNEGEILPEPDHLLQVTPTGQVVTTYPDAESMSSLNAAFAQTLKPSIPSKGNPQEFETFRKELLRKVRELLNYTDSEVALNLQSRGNANYQGHSVDFLTYDVEAGITLPALFFKPAAATPDWKTPVLYVSDRSKAEDANTEIHALVKAGHPVLSADVRGKGETERPGQDEGNFGTWFSTDYQIAMMALQLRKPLVGMRVLDLTKSLDVLESLSGKTDGGFVAIGKGSGTIPLLHLAALDQRVKILILEKGLVSWNHMIENPYHRRQLDNIVQAAFQSYDFPVLAAAVAPRTLVLGNMVNAVGHILRTDEVAEEYATTKECFGMLGRPQQFGVIERKPGVSLVEAYADYLCED